jgi:hypothetical protein
MVLRCKRRNSHAGWWDKLTSSSFFKSPFQLFRACLGKWSVFAFEWDEISSDGSLSSLCLRAELQDVYHGTVGHNSFLMMVRTPHPPFTFPMRSCVFVPSLSGQRIYVLKTRLKSDRILCRLHANAQDYAPTPEGLIAPDQVARYKEFGKEERARI